jgi:AsmA protein
MAMKKLLLIIVGLLATLLVVVLLAAALLPRLVDTDSLKEQLSAQASAAAGRPVAIDGPLSFSVFPQLALEVQQLRIAEPGAGGGPAGSVARASVAVALGRLLSGELLVKGVTLEGAEFNLQSAPGDMNLRLTGLNVATGALDLQQLSARPVPISASGLLEDVNTGISRRFELDTQATVNPATQQYRLDQLDLRLQDPAGTFPPLRLQLEQLQADLAAETASFVGLEVALAELRVSGEGQASALLSQPAFNASLNAGPFSPRALLTSLGQEVPFTTDPAVLGEASLSAVLEGNGRRVDIADLVMHLDDSRISGDLSVLNLAKPAVLFNIAVDELNLDRYLPPPPSASGGQASATPPSPLPLAALAALRAQGALAIARLQVLNLPLGNVRMELAAASGVARINPLEAQLFDGRYTGDISIDGTGLAPAVRFNERLVDVNLGPLLLALQGVDSLSGLVQAQASGTALGEDTAQLIATLNGNMDMRLENGALEGVDIDHRVRSALAILRGGDAGTTDRGRTEIRQLSMQAVMENGLVVTDSISAQLAFLDVGGIGVVDLNQMLLDLELEATVSAGTGEEPDPLFKGLSGRNIPVSISGPLGQPEVTVDAGRALQQELGRRLLDRLRGN